MVANVLLDLDGTLLDSNDAHAFSWIEALQEFHIQAEFAKIRKLIGMGSDQLLPSLGIESEDERGKQISKRRGEIFREKYLNELKPFPKSRELIERIVDDGFRVVVATSASKEDLKGLLKQIGIKDLIHNWTHADEAENSKPSPDIIQMALEKIQAAPQESVMLGDTPYDIQAAAKSGVMTVAFTCGGWSTEELKDAIAIYEGPWQLWEHFESSALKGHLQKQILADETHVETRVRLEEYAQPRVNSRLQSHP